MNPRILPLLAALDAAQAEQNDARLLRLFVQNAPRFPQVPSLRRYVWRVALARGQSDLAEAIIRRTVLLEMAAGSVMAAVAALRAGEAAGFDLAELWGRLFSDVAARGFAPTIQADADGDAEPDLEADRPGLDGEALDTFAFQAAARDPEVRLDLPHYQPTPWIERLPTAALRLTLIALDGARVDAGTRFEPSAEPPAWLVLGDLRDDDGHAIPAGSALAGMPGVSLTAFSTCWMVTTSQQAWSDLLRDHAAERSWDHAVRRQRLVHALRGFDAWRMADTALRWTALSRAVLYLGQPGPLPHLSPADNTAWLLLSGSVRHERAGASTEHTYFPGEAIATDLRGGRLVADDPYEIAEIPHAASVLPVATLDDAITMNSTEIDIVEDL